MEELSFSWRITFHHRLFVIVSACCWPYYCWLIGRIQLCIDYLPCWDSSETRSVSLSYSTPHPISKGQLYWPLVWLAFCSFCFGFGWLGSCSRWRIWCEPRDYYASNFSFMSGILLAACADEVAFPRLPSSRFTSCCTQSYTSITSCS